MIVAIVGPTGVGKTKMSVALAKKYNAVVINCDAMQVYKDLNIGTAKIKESEKEAIERAERMLKAETGKDFVLIAWEKK